MTDYHFGPLFRFVEDTAIYMESGYLALLSTAPCNINTPRPAVLHYSTPTSAYVQSKTTPLQGKIFVSTDENLDEFPFTGQALDGNSESRAVGCSTSVKTATFTDECETTYTVLPEDVAAEGFCPLANILKKKKAIANVPSSMFSGKLRLMVQAICGSTRTDIELVEVESFVVPGKLLVAGFQLSALYSPSYGLYTTPDFEYFLVEVTTSQVNYYPLILSATAQQFAAILKDHPRKTEQTFTKKIEAYILSTAIIDEDNVIAGGELTELNGQPLYYGWHWSWDGQQADIVLHAEDNVNHRYDVRRHRLQISRIDGVFSEELTTEETGYWWPQYSMGINIFIPEPIQNKLQVIIPVVEDHTNGIPIPGQFGTIPAAPLHCFRKSDDELIICRFSSNVISKTNFETVSGPDACSDQERMDRDSRTYAGANGSNSLSIGDIQISGQIATSSNSFHQNTYPDGGFYHQEYRNSETANNYGIPLTSPMCGGVTLEQFLISTGFYERVGVNLNPKAHGSPVVIDGKTWFPRYVISLNTINRYRIQERNATEYTHSTGVFLQLPFDSCSSVYYGQRTRALKTSHVIATETPHSFDWEGVSVWDALHDNANSFIYLAEVAPNRPRLGNSLGFTGLTDGPTETVDTFTGAVNIYVSDFDDVVYTETDDSPLGSYFDISYFEYPFVDQFDVIFEDTSGGYKFTYKSAPSDAAKYPGDGAVGWV